jgi:hypothetical protein
VQPVLTQQLQAQLVHKDRLAQLVQLEIKVFKVSKARLVQQDLPAHKAYKANKVFKV